MEHVVRRVLQVTMEEEWDMNPTTSFLGNTGHYDSTPVSTPQHSYILLLGPGRNCHLGHTVPTPSVPNTQLAILVPAKRPKIVALCETNSVSRATANIYNSTFSCSLATENITCNTVIYL